MLRLWVFFRTFYKCYVLLYVMEFVSIEISECGHEMCQETL